MKQYRETAYRQLVPNRAIVFYAELNLYILDYLLN